MLNESRNISMRSNMKRYCSCREETETRSMHIPVGLQISMLKLTTESTLPGFWMRSAFTTWNTSTMPSILQHSVALIREQNTPHRLTVSLHVVEVCVCVCVCVCMQAQKLQNTNLHSQLSTYMCKMGEGPNPCSLLTCRGQQWVCFWSSSVSPTPAQ